MTTTPSPRLNSSEQEYITFSQLLRRQTGVDLSFYKQAQMERRIRSFAEREGIKELSLYWRFLSRNPAELERFLSQITINVSEFFRNPDSFSELQKVVLPEILLRQQKLFIWSAGCSCGAEIYTVKMIMQQLSPRTPVKLLATDIDRPMLYRAKEGIYSPDEVKCIPRPLLEKYFSAVNGNFQIEPAFREGVEFTEQNLLKDSFPAQVDLILCRNVTIYFSDEAKNRLNQRFFEALRPGGYLLIGSSERIADAKAIGFESPRPFFYRRPL